MAELKTKLNDNSVPDFLNSIENEQKRKDSFEIVEIMKSVTQNEPNMWGSSIIGFGQYHYKYASGRERDWMQVGFSPRKQNLTIYLMCDLGKNPELTNKLGKFKLGKGCLYIKKLDDIDRILLKNLIKESIKILNEKYNK